MGKNDREVEERKFFLFHMTSARLNLRCMRVQLCATPKSHE